VQSTGTSFHVRGVGSYCPSQLLILFPSIAGHSTCAVPNNDDHHNTSDEFDDDDDDDDGDENKYLVNVAILNGENLHSTVTKKL
jgi:hypothetical protein